MKISLKPFLFIFGAINIILFIIVAGFCIPAYFFGGTHDRDSIRNLLENPTAPVLFFGEQPNWQGDQFFYRSGESKIYVNKETGNIDFAALLSIPTSEKGPLTEQGAEDLAKSFAGRHYSNFTTRNMQLIKSLAIDHGWGVEEYTFRWIERYQDINVGNFVEIWITPQGTVVAYFSNDDPIPQIKPPKISRGQAMEIVNRSILGSHINITNISHENISSSLTISLEHQKKLVWEVGYDYVIFTDTPFNFHQQDPGNPFRNVNLSGTKIIDAMTGEILPPYF